ncbi:MAG TPA: glycosyltransferase family 39 protein [Roseiflexaceae bacterium]|nr:glycosyltransferase family 39 protein [Roseiflexaceae bacterium]
MQHYITEFASQQRALHWSRILRSPALWLALLAAQYTLVQLALNVQYGDGPRNLHWALVVAENPAFLIGDVDVYDHINGFVPDPPALAPQRRANNSTSSYNVLWGPTPMLLLAPVWWLSGSRVALALVVPIVGGATVIACYRLGRRLFDQRSALAASIFLAFFPLFFERSVVSYAEPISALFLLLALSAYLRGRTALTVLFGSLTVLCKINMGPIYCGVIGCSLLYRLYRRRDAGSVRRSLIALILPALALMGWYWLRTGSPLPTTGSSLSLYVLRRQSLDMLQMLFYIPWYGAILTLIVIGVCAAYGLSALPRAGEERVILLSWIGFGILALVVYMATTGMDNSPRALLPSIPALALLVGAGWARLSEAWARRVAIYLVGLFLVVNCFISYYGWEYGRFLETFQGAWQVLREQPRGLVLTATCWPTVFQTRQPVTWFESDRQFEENILYDRENFIRYTRAYNIRYVLVPREGTAAAIAEPFIQVDTARLYGDEVLAYLRGSAQDIPVPPYYDLYVLPQSRL